MDLIISAKLGTISGAKDPASNLARVAVLAILLGTWSGTAQSKVLSPHETHDLDQLISDRAKAEADLESMMSEMRRRMKGE